MMVYLFFLQNWLYLDNSRYKKDKDLEYRIEKTSYGIRKTYISTLRAFDQLTSTQKAYVWSVIDAF